MEEITAYKLSNGDIVESHAEAEVIERRFLFERRVKEFAEKVGAYEGKAAIREAILGNANELAEILELR